MAKFILDTTQLSYRSHRERAFTALNEHFQKQLHDATTGQNAIMASAKLHSHAAHSKVLFERVSPFIPGGIVATSWYSTLEKISQPAGKMNSSAGKALAATFAEINALDDEVGKILPKGLIAGNLVKRVQAAKSAASHKMA